MGVNSKEKFQIICKNEKLRMLEDGRIAVINVGKEKNTRVSFKVASYN